MVLVQLAVDVMATFNSLSRDHRLGELGQVARNLVRLSTPSLGITFGVLLVWGFLF